MTRSPCEFPWAHLAGKKRNVRLSLPETRKMEGWINDSLLSKNSWIVDGDYLEHRAETGRVHSLCHQCRCRRDSDTIPCHWKGRVMHCSCRTGCYLSWGGVRNQMVQGLDWDRGAAAAVQSSSCSWRTYEGVDDHSVVARSRDKRRRQGETWRNNKGLMYI